MKEYVGQLMNQTLKEQAFPSGQSLQVAHDQGMSQAFNQAREQDDHFHP